MEKEELILKYNEELNNIANDIQEFDQITKEYGIVKREYRKKKAELWLTTDFKARGLTNDTMRKEFVKNELASYIDKIEEYERLISLKDYAIESEKIILRKFELIK